MRLFWMRPTTIGDDVDARRAKVRVADGVRCLNSREAVVLLDEPSALR
jgi:hypothetical protein